MRKVVVNSSPLIALCGIGKLGLLREIYGEIAIPLAVYQEISAKQDSLCKHYIDNAAEWVRICQIRNTLAKRLFKAKLHAGEVEAMILAQEQNADLLIIDDALAKRHAIYLGINVTGTLGVLIKARQMNLISELAPLLQQLRRNNIYVSEKLISYCLQKVGES
ncbi:MAG: DUF3368 domain-containing protein [Selenomonadaceae bacterium]|nr:DUF3368 domain-containing protein [Selenomonadaceae bacterium]